VGGSGDCHRLDFRRGGPNHKFIFGKSNDMKKSVFFAILIVLMSFSSMTLADVSLPTAGELGIPSSPIDSVSKGVKILSSIVGWTYRVFFILTVLFVLMAAYKYLTKADEAEKIKEARQQLIYAAIAVVVALLAVGFSAIIGNFLENPNPPADSEPNGGQGGPLSPDYPI
jgi:FtsH-binding integral membrane protein